MKSTGKSPQAPPPRTTMKDVFPGPGDPFRDLIEQIPAITYIAWGNKRSSTVYVSPQVKPILGFTPDEWLADPEIWVRRLHTGDRDRVLKEAGHSFATGRPFSSVYRMLSQSGRVVWFRDEARIIAGAEGQPGLIQGVMLDITACKQVEEELQKAHEELEGRVQERTWELAQANERLRREIDERIKTEEALADRESFLASIFSSIQDGICVLDHELNLVQVNRTVEKWFPEAMPLTGRKCYEAYHGRQEPCEGCPAARTLKTGKPEWGVIPCSCKGEERWMEVFAFPLMDINTGKMKGVIEYARDVSQRRKMEEALFQSEEKYRSLFEEAAIGIFRSTPEGKFIEVNPALARMLGYESPQAVVESITDIAEQVYWEPQRRAEVVRLIQESRGIVKFELESRRQNGEKWVANLNARVGYDPQGNQVFLEGFVEDITEKKQAQEALKEREERLKLVLEGSNDGFWDWHIQTGEGFASQSWFEMMGYSPDELPQRFQTWEQLIHPDDVPSMMKSLYHHLHGLTSHYEVEYRMKTKNGDWKWILGRGKVVAWDAQGDPWRMAGTVTDISARKEAEEALRESEEKYRLLVDKIPAVVFKGYADWSVDFFDRKVEDLTGYRKEDFDSRRVKWCDLIPPEDFDYVQSVFLKALKGDKSYVREHRIRRKNGEIRWVQCRGQIFCDAQGKVDHISGVTFDITPGQLAEEALQESEARFRTLAYHAPIGIYQTDSWGNCTFVNERWCEIAGLSPEEARGQGWVKALHPEDRERVYQEWQRAVETEQEFSGEYRFQTPEGKVTWVAGRGVAFRNDKGEIIGHLGTVADISDLKRLAEELRAGEEKYRLVADFNYDWEYWQSPDGKLLYVSPSCHRITGYRAEEFHANPELMVAITHPADRVMVKEHTQESLHEHLGVFNYDFRIITRNGEERWISHYCQPIYDKNGIWQGRRASNRDITERKLTEEQFHHAQKMEAVGKLAGGVAHDFNNLLMAILGFSDLIMGRPKLDSRVSNYVKEIIKAAERANALTRQLLAFSRRQVLQLQPVNLNNLIKDMQKILRRLIGEDVNLVLNLDQNLHMVKADPGQMEQIILNLVINAKDAMPFGGEILIETANASLDESHAHDQALAIPGDYVGLTIRDTGVGMDAETQARIFEPFFTTKELGKGTGLGLSVVYGIVRQSGGHVQVASEPGKGTIFRICLPRIKESKRSVKKESLYLLPAKGSHTVLVVEDEETLRKVISEFLTRYGYKVLEAGNGEEALRLGEQLKEPIDLILTDIVMPNMSGFELVKRLAPLRPGMKAIYMSGYAEDEIAPHGELLKDLCFLQKPLRINALLRKIKEMLESVND